MFHIWPQIEEIFNSNGMPLDLALQLHPHAARYLLVYPCIFLADAFGVQLDIIYSLFVCSCWVGAVYLSFSILKREHVANLTLYFSYYFLAIGYFFLLIFTNGRGILATFGIMLFFFIQWQETEFPLWKKFLGLTLAFFLCSVSTGISFCFSISLLLILMMNLKVERFFFLVFFVFPILCYFAYISFEKNITYFGSIISLFDHGLPGIFAIPAFKGGMVVMIVFFAYFTYYTLYKEFGKSVIILVMYILGGLFGNLTFVVVIPPLFTAFLFHCIKNNTFTRVSSTVIPLLSGPLFRKILIVFDSIRKEEKINKKISASLKLKIAIEAFKGEMTIEELASRYEVSPAQIHNWKHLLLEHGTRLFEGVHNPSHTTQDNEIQKFHANGERLTVENNSLSRDLGQLK